MAAALKSLFTKNIAGWPLRRHLLVALALFCVILIAGYTAIITSDAYVLAKKYALSNPKVADALGGVSSARLGFGRFSMKLSEPYSSMRFTLVVSGQKTDGTILFELTKRGDAGWVIEQARFDSSKGEVELVETAPQKKQ